MIIAEVLLPLVKLFPLDYKIPQDISVKTGDLVLVAFRNKMIAGIIWHIKSETKFPTKIKLIEQKLEYSVSPEFLLFLQKAKDYYLAQIGSIAKLALPLEISGNNRKKHDIEYGYNLNLAALSNEQMNALAEIRQNQYSLLKGVTGSGKTEVYFHLAQEFVSQGKQALILLPEIALSNQMIQRFEMRFGFKPAIWNSSKTTSYKKQVLKDIINGDAKIVIGARSATFLPFANLGLIVVDEEHDASYKQDMGILYNARDMCALRCQMQGIKLLLISATPSIESYNNTRLGKYNLVKLESRYKASMPEISLIDLKKHKLPPKKWISLELKKHIHDALGNNQQVLLFLNRKGYAPLMVCGDCGYRFCCINCETWLVYHKSSGKLICHHCGYFNMLQNNCTQCMSEDSYVPCGPGIERIKEEIEQIFPHNSICMLSRNQDGSADADLEKIINKITNHQYDIIIGTQMITKGLHFPSVGMVGVVDSDVGFKGGDLRAMEKTFQLLSQVGGRAGREKFAGRVYLQTYYADSKLMQLLQTNNYDDFINEEMLERASGSMPPFSRMASIVIAGSSDELTKATSKELAKKRVIIDKIQVLGPAPANILRINNKYRYRFIVIAPRNFNLQSYIEKWLALVKIKSTINVVIDIDPYNLI